MGLYISRLLILVYNNTSLDFRDYQKFKIIYIIIRPNYRVLQDFICKRPGFFGIIIYRVARSVDSISRDEQGSP